MDFDNDYWNAFSKEAPPYQASIATDLAVSAHPMRDQLQELKSKIFAGVKAVELGFIARGKGSRAQGAITPEMFGREEREAIRQLAKINEIELSTHSSANVIGFSGLAEGGFKEEAREAALHETERSIEFAADTAGGGAVVIHTGEFPRPLFETPGGKLEGYPEEAKTAPMYLVDKRTGQLRNLPRDTEIETPKWKTDNKGNIQKDELGNPVPERDPKTSLIIFDKAKKIYDIEQEAIKKGEDPGKYIYGDLIKKEIQLNEAEELRFYHASDEHREQIKTLGRMKEELKEAKDKEFVTQFVAERLGGMGRLSPEKAGELKKDPMKFIDGAIEEQSRQIRFYEEASQSYARRRYESQEMIKNLVPIKEYALDQTADTIARAAIKAYQVEREKGLSRPLFIAPENIFAEQYGAHPQELKEIVIKSREKMVDRLTKQGMGEEQAKKVAEEHVKATLDVGHANTLKKYFKGDEKDSNKWLINELDKLAKEGYIGHVHLNDNFGYEDEHITPGQGTTPIKEFVESLKKSGFKGRMIVEPAGQPEGMTHTAVTGTWRLLHSPVYKLDGMHMTWGDFDQSYFGRTGSPSYLVGESVPSKDWTLWSETQLE